MTKLSFGSTNMDKPINERLIKISSRLPYPSGIELGEDVIININTKGMGTGQSYVLNCVKTEDMDNQDGTINRIYTLKFLGE
jgi:hypothetical protein